MASSGVTKAEVLSLYRSLLRTARRFSDYNIREYTKRRAIDGFRQNKHLTDPSAISAAYSDGRAQLEVAKRQAIIYSLYTPSIKSVMEVSPH
uniref:Complex 1 LYR protein domain-containing protein n=1 Tax=Rhizophora mucronata TaxID=61149 RepID=A0A2P2IK86_RHIMU